MNPKGLYHIHVYINAHIQYCSCIFVLRLLTIFMCMCQLLLFAEAAAVRSYASRPSSWIRSISSWSSGGHSNTGLDGAMFLTAMGLQAALLAVEAGGVQSRIHGT